MPEIHRSIASFRTALDGIRRRGGTVGFVPTMGYLHEGHASLMSMAADECSVAAASVFVNPLQFAANEDLGSYPRDLDRDVALAARCGVAHLLVPSVEEMYPDPIVTTVSVAGITARFEGASRPEHFAGVATVVAKLFSIAGACHAYFGEKDYQQLVVVRRLVRDLSMPVEVVGCPTLREADGLAMSSRNVYLTPAQRRAAPVLQRSLREAADAAPAVADPRAIEAMVVARLDAEPEARLDYVALVDADDLEPAVEVRGEQRLLVAAFFGTTRLLDNIAFVS